MKLLELFLNGLVIQILSNLYAPSSLFIVSVPLLLIAMAYLSQCVVLSGSWSMIFALSQLMVELLAVTYLVT